MEKEYKLVLESISEVGWGWFLFNTLCFAINAYGALHGSFIGLLFAIFMGLALYDNITDIRAVYRGKINRLK